MEVSLKVGCLPYANEKGSCPYLRFISEENRRSGDDDGLRKNPKIDQ